MTTNFTHKLEIPEEMKDKLGAYIDKNPDIFKLFKNLGPIDVEGVRKQADKIRAERAKEEKEKMKTPALESENHKIDTGLSKKEKLVQGWKEEERPAHIYGPANIDGTETKIKVLKKELAEGAYVREYQDDGVMPSHLVGEQLFNRKAVENLQLQDRIPTYAQYQKMGFGGKNHKDAMDKNFKKGDNLMLSGYRNPKHQKFYYIGKGTDCRFADGGTVGLNKVSMTHNISHIHPEFGFSLRLLQSA